MGVYRDVTQEIAGMPADVQQTFTNRVVTDRLAKSVVKRLVSTYQALPEEVGKAVLEDPRPGHFRDRLTPTGRVCDRRSKEGMEAGALSLERSRNTLTLLFRLTGEAQAPLAGLWRTSRF